MKKQIVRGGCLNCPSTEDILDIDTVLYNGFGGYHVKKDGKLFYEGDSKGEFDSFRKLHEIDSDAKNSPESKWEVILNNPLRGATWERNQNGEWILTESNNGFA